MKLRITIPKYHSWYLCQISLQIMLLPIKISKFIIYMSLSIPEYSSLHPGLFKWIWIPAFAIISLHALYPSSSTTLNKDHGHWFEESSSLCPANDRPPEVAQFTCVETATENRKSVVLFKKTGSYQVWNSRFSQIQNNPEVYHPRKLECKKT